MLIIHWVLCLIIISTWFLSLHLQVLAYNTVSVSSLIILYPNSTIQILYVYLTGWMRFSLRWGYLQLSVQTWTELLLRVTVKTTKDVQWFIQLSSYRAQLSSIWVVLESLRHSHVVDTIPGSHKAHPSGAVTGYCALKHPQDSLLTQLFHWRCQPNKSRYKSLYSADCINKTCGCL